MPGSALSPQSSSAEIILEIVRGVRPPEDLRLAGIEVRQSKTEPGQTVYEIANPHEVVAVASAVDVALGLLRYVDDRAALQQWASMLEAGSSFLDLNLEDHPLGESLLDALLRASFGEPLPEAIVNDARDLVARWSN